MYPPFADPWSQCGLAPGLRRALLKFGDGLSFRFFLRSYVVCLLYGFALPAHDVVRRGYPLLGHSLASRPSPLPRPLLPGFPPPSSLSAAARWAPLLPLPPRSALPMLFLLPFRVPRPLSPVCGASHRSPARAAITMPTLSSSCWPPPCVLLSSVVCGITWGVWARNPDMRVNAGGELTDAALEAAANRVERRAQPTKPRKRNACDYTRNTASARDAARRTRGARRGPYARASQISHVPVSQSVSYFTVPPRAHPSTGSQSGSATPGLTQVPSTRSQGLLNCRR